ncbi:MAG TPA: hypothetical protein VFH17_02385, partial [Coriobacteriia bacterium]|nr:hypothetical protein [Coriobacteriia bacterium]
WTGWVVGTAAGALAAPLLGDPARWGADFAMPAMFTALLLALAEDRRHMLAACVAGALAVSLPLLNTVGIAIPSSWIVVIASMGAATCAAVAFR